MKEYSLFLILSVALIAGCEHEPSGSTSAPASTLDSLGTMVAYIKDNPSDPVGYYNKGRFLLDKERYSLALEEVERGLRADSGYAPLHLVRGDLSMELRDVENAYYSYSNCARIDSTQVECLMSLAELEIGLGNIKKARALLNSVLRKDMYTARAYAIRGYMYSQLGDTTIALSSYQTAVEVDPEDYDSFIALGLIYSDQNQDLAIDAFDSALELEPKSTEALYAKALYMQNSSEGDTIRLNKSLAIYRDINSIDPTNSPAFYNQGYIYLEYLNNYEKAEEAFSNAIAVYPGYYQAFFNRGLAKHSLQKLEGALRDYDKALSLKPDFTPAAKMKEQVLIDLGKI